MNQQQYAFRDIQQHPRNQDPFATGSTFLESIIFGRMCNILLLTSAKTFELKQKTTLLSFHRRLDTSLVPNQKVAKEAKMLDGWR